MSAYFVHKWLHSHFGAASTAAKSAQEDLANGNYGLVSLSHGSEGHIVVPLSVETDGSEYWIYVYDSNYPCRNPTEDYHSYPKVIINGNNWSYEFDRDSNVTWTQSGGDIAYVPYHPDARWDILVNGLEDILLIAFGNNTNVDQMTDKNGRQLFKNSPPQGPADVDRSANGLGNDIVQIPIVGWGHPIPRDPAGPPFVLTYPPEPSEFIDTTNQMMAEYAPDYSFSGQLHAAQNLQLEQLEIQLSNSDPNNPVRALINRPVQWHEIKFDGAGNGAPINPSLTVEKISDLTRSVTVRERNGQSMKCSFTYGLISMVDQNITIQKADAVDVGTATITAQINKDGSLQLFTNGQNQQTNISTRVTDSTGTIKDMPVRTQTVHPKITCPSNITVECSALGGTPASDPTIAAFLSGAQATDNCECVPAIRNSAPGLFPPGSTKVEWTAADADNNLDAGSICSANVTVVDTTPPTITCPPAVKMECESMGQANVKVPPATASDTCSGAATIVNDHTANGADGSGSYPLGTTVVTYIAKDVSGNSATCMTTVTVADTTPPVIGVSLNPNVLWPPNHKMVDIAASVAVTDKCDPSPTFVLTSIISNEPDNGLGDGDTVNDIQKADIGKPDVQFQLRAERSGKGNGRVYTIVYTASDGSNNKASVTGYVQVPHN
jgi:hypothetical protein